MEDPTSDNIVSVKEVAEFLHITEETAYNLAKSGKIPAVKIGRQWRFNLAEVKKLFKIAPVLPTEPDAAGGLEWWRK